MIVLMHFTSIYLIQNFTSMAHLFEMFNINFIRSCNVSEDKIITADNLRLS